MAVSFPLVVFDLDGTLTRPGAARAVPGGGALVEGLAARGWARAVATSASTRVAHRVLAEIGLGGAFDSVAGRGLDGGYAGKDGVVAEALLGLGLEVAPAGSVLLGDSLGDLAAARAHALRPVGAGWGGTPPEVLRGGGAEAVLAAPDELWALSA